ncbi:hypothetical protein SAMN05192562_101909 [Kosakonia arachidis]|uniref:Uncharacterized protein n=1 Tax=Kosakonia arachidis TaxID=551989 RepID=A0A1I6Z2F6_9ENTR|nr:hypothetical protein SAMN05192562_101909 [Kosakonia arachidis]
MNIIPGALAVDRIRFGKVFVSAPGSSQIFFTSHASVARIFVEIVARRLFLRNKPGLCACGMESSSKADFAWLKSGTWFKHLRTNTLLSELPQQRH